MWILLLITLSGSYPDGSTFPQLTSKIESYRTLEDCQTERERVATEMNESYPNERDKFRLECKPARRIQ